MLTYVKQYANLYLEPRALQMLLITKNKNKIKGYAEASGKHTTAVSGLTLLSSNSLAGHQWLGHPCSCPRLYSWVPPGVPRNLNMVFSTLIPQNLGSFPLLSCFSFSLSPSLSSGWILTFAEKSAEHPGGEAFCLGRWKVVLCWLPQIPSSRRRCLQGLGGEPATVQGILA